LRVRTYRSGSLGHGGKDDDEDDRDKNADQHEQAAARQMRASKREGKVVSRVSGCEHEEEKGVKRKQARCKKEP